MIRLLTMAVCTVLCLASQSFGQSATTATPAALKKYSRPYTPTRLEWNLLQVNFAWIGSFRGPETGSYITSAQIIYRTDRQAFYTAFNVGERRDPSDPERFSSLTVLRQRAVLQEGIDQAIGILKTFFPELERQPELLLVEFWYSGGVVGGRTLVASYEKGVLNLTR